MPICGMNTLKLLVLNEDKSRGVTFEYPNDMKNGELLDKVLELETEIKKAIAKEKENAEKKDSEKPEAIVPEVVEEKKEEEVVG